MELTGLVDTHVHSGPDAVPRLLSDLGVARAAASAHYRAIVLKSHHTITVPRAQLVAERVPGLKVLGGLALNYHSCGGMNPVAVQTAIALGASIIWMPTISSVSQARIINEGGGSAIVRAIPGGRACGVPVLGSRGQLTQSAKDVLDVIATGGVTLATGHLSGQELVTVIPEAVARGVQRIIVNHPESEPVAMSMSTQVDLSQLPGVWFERTFVSTLPDREGVSATFEKSIRAVGIARTVLSSDLGQVENPSPVEGMREFLGCLSDRGFTEAELEVMSCTAPALAMGLDPGPAQF
jgi:hypothetical protein